MLALTNKSGQEKLHPYFDFLRLSSHTIHVYELRRPIRQEHMRTKTEQRRDAILRIAHAAFCENGFEATSMSLIASRLGGSKSTLYNYFSSKEEILLAVLTDGAEQFSADVIALLQEVDNYQTQLLRFVESLIALLHKPETIQILRVAISVGATSDIGRKFLERGTNDAWRHIAQVLANEIQRGNLRNEDPVLMASHLRCLCELDLIHQLMGARVNRSKADIRVRAEQTIDVFLRAYGTKK